MRTWSLAVSGSGGAGGKICDGRDKRVGGGRGDIDAFPGHDELVVDLQNLGDGGKRTCLPLLETERPGRHHLDAVGSAVVTALLDQFSSAGPTSHVLWQSDFVGMARTL